MSVHNGHLHFTKEEKRKKTISSGLKQRTKIDQLNFTSTCAGMGDDTGAWVKAHYVNLRFK